MDKVVTPRKGQLIERAIFADPDISHLNAGKTYKRFYGLIQAA
jgi:hypothetical protein